MHNIEGIHAPSHLHTSAQITKLSNNLMHKPTLFTISWNVKFIIEQKEKYQSIKQSRFPVRPWYKHEPKEGKKVEQIT